MFDPPSDRPDPLALLEEQAKARVPELVPVRWGRMMVSPFTFYRGAALPTATVATYAYVNPVIAVLLGALILNERLTPAMIGGGVLILGAVVLVVRRSPPAH